jgi:hypothetical protein
MGAMQAMEMAEMLSIEDSIRWHLRSNHYPPVPLSMVDTCIEAINACNELDYDRLIQLPFDGVHKDTGEPFQITWRGQDKAPAHAIVEGHHLHSWIELDEEYED